MCDHNGPEFCRGWKNRVKKVQNPQKLLALNGVQCYTIKRTFVHGKSVLTVETQRGKEDSNESKIIC